MTKMFTKIRYFFSHFLVLKFFERFFKLYASTFFAFSSWIYNQYIFCANFSTLNVKIQSSPCVKSLTMFSVERNNNPIIEQNIGQFGIVFKSYFLENSKNILSFRKSCSKFGKFLNFLVFFQEFSCIFL